MIIKLRKSREGFTLIEVIVGLIVFGIVIGVVAVTIASSLKTIDAIKKRQNITMEGEIGISQFSREFKMLSDNKSIKAASDQRLKFTNKWGKTLEYKLDDGKLYRKEGNKEKQILVENVDIDSSGFSYWDIYGNALSSSELGESDRRAVWLVQLTLDLDFVDQSIRYSEKVFPENLKFTGEGIEEEACECEHGVRKINMRYVGVQNDVTVKVYNGSKVNKKKLIITFDDVDPNQALLVDGSGLQGGKFASDILWQVVETDEETVVHVSCSEPLIVGTLFGNFTLLGYKDDEGNQCGSI